MTSATRSLLSGNKAMPMHFKAFGNQKAAAWHRKEPQHCHKLPTVAFLA
jgi:hypothetical protein